MTLRVLLASSSLLAKPLLEVLQADSRVKLLGVVSTPDKPKGRHGTATPNELVADLSVTGIDVWKPESHPEILATIELLRPDLVIVVAYGKLIKPAALSLVPHGWVNLHFSLLPAYRGAAPVQRSLLQGDEEFGFTFFRIDEGLDTGPIFIQERCTVSGQGPATEILKSLSAQAASRLSALISMLLEGEEPKPQQGSTSLAPKIEKGELALNLDAPGTEMIRQIRAFTRKPGVWFTYAGKRCIITSARMGSVPLRNQLISFHSGQALLGTGESSIEILSIVPEGRREMSGSDWIRGMRFHDGESRSVSTGQ